jgi:cytochrome P450
MISDPKAVQHIYNNASIYVRQIQNSEMFRMIGGPGLTVVTGDDHKRQRKIMQPAFGIPYIKSLFPIISRHADKVCQQAFLHPTYTHDHLL